MIGFSNVNDINKQIRSILIEQSGLSDDMVLNALSLYGTELDKYLEESIFESIDQKDVLLLFELNSRDSNNNVSYTTKSNLNKEIITYYKTYSLKLILYGDSSSDVANELVARLRTETIRTQSYEKGIFIERVYDPFILNEFKNNTLWIRNDITIDIGIMYEVSPISKDDDFSSYSDIKVVKY